MRNFMSYDRRWLDEPHVGDHVGRSIWALGDVLTTAWVPALVEPAQRLLASLVRSLDGELSLRTAAYTALGLARLDRRPARRRRAPAARALRRRSWRLAYDDTAGDGWHWFEDSLDLRQRPPVAGADRRRRRARARRRGRGRARARSPGSATSAGSRTGRCGCPGTRGGIAASRRPGAGDEQPLDASAFVEAELVGVRRHRRRRSTARARKRAFEWFLGRNQLGRPLYDFATGGCCDGLGADDVNANEGAESTLAFHRAQLVLDAAGLPRVVRARRRARSRLHDERARALPPASRRTRS